MHESKGDAILVFLSVFLVAGCTAILTVLLTSDFTPLGRHVYALLAQADPDPAGAGVHPYQVSLGISLLFVFLGYLTDVHLWRSVWQPFVKIYAAVTGLFFLGAVVLYSSEAPSIPPLVGLGLGVLLVRLLRATSFSHVPSEQFCNFAGMAYALAGLLCFTVWAGWAFTAWMGLHNWDWNEPARPSLASQNFVRWCSPVMVAMVHALIALFLRWRSRMHMMDNYVLAELKLICSLFVLLFLCSWLAASIAAGDAALSKVVLRISFLLTVSTAVYLISTVGPQAILKACEDNVALGLLMPLLTSDWAKGAFTLCFLPLVPFIMAIEVLHNSVRRRMQRHSMTQVEKGTHTWITHEAAYAVEVMGEWHVSSVLTKSQWIGVIVFTMQVGCGRGIVVLLAFVCEHSLALSWPAVIGILYGVGVALFLLPPVPGCPIYMISAILITKRFEATGRHFVLASLLATVFAMVIKLSAVALQQKLIGEPFSDSVRVKRLVAIHTPEMKAIRHILSQPGLQIDKVIVLVCGPDWPTSVLTGILKLPLFQMLLGTLPVFLLIMPFTLTGSFIVHASTLPNGAHEKRRLEGMASALLFFSVLAQIGGLMLIFQCTHGTTERFKDEIQEGKWMQDSQEAELLREVAREEEQRRLRNERTRWAIMPWWVRMDLLLGAVLMSLMMYIIILPFLKPFKDFSLQDKFSDLEGVEFLVNKPGWVAIAFLCCSFVCLLVFEGWCSGAASSPKEERAPLLLAVAPPGAAYGGASAQSV
mmetsp:Transcript_17352/g.52317  ORF Transcript_17352/g.52317 Transcript_17352/m.52317 type:complete len:759 (+) Transcript_17352:140-2416(+)